MLKSFFLGFRKQEKGDRFKVKVKRFPGGQLFFPQTQLLVWKELAEEVFEEGITTLKYHLDVHG